MSGAGSFDAWTLGVPFMAVIAIRWRPAPRAGCGRGRTRAGSAVASRWRPPRSRRRSASPRTRADADEQGDRVHVGAGAAWQLAPAWSLHLDYVSYYADPSFLSFGVRRRI